MSFARIDKTKNKKPFSGFVNRTDSSISINGSGVFTIQPTGVNYDIYTESRGKITLNSAQNVTVTDDQTITFIYFNENGVLQSSTSMWDMNDGDNIPVAVVFKDSTVYTLTDERHSYQRNLDWHEWAHFNIGTMYRSGLTGAFTDTTFSVAQGVIFDEDISFDTGGTETTTSLWYRNSGSGMRLERNSTTPKYVSGGVLQYDNGSGTPVDVTLNRYVTNFVYATNDPDEPIYTVIGQNDSVNLTDAQNVSNPIINLLTAEWKLIYRLIFRRTAGLPDGELVEVEDFREVQTGTSSTSVSPSSHTALIDRDAANSHPIGAITGVSTEVIYGGTSGELTSEGAFTYDASGDILSVVNIDLNTTLVTEGIFFNGNLAISDGDDTFLRLNDNGDFTGGVYTPGVIRADGGYSVDGRAMISGDGVLHTAQNTDDTHYGYFEMRNNSGTRGAFLGWGNGGNLVSMELDNADYFNIANGDLGVNQITPTAKLHIVGDTSDDSEYVFKADNTSGNIMRIRNDGKIAINTGSDPQYDVSFDNFHFDDSDASPNAGYLRFGDSSGWKYHWGRAQETPAGAYNTDTTGVLMTLVDSGDLGIGTLTPNAKLDVNGGIKLADDTDTCDATKVGTLRYNSDSNNSYCDMCMQDGAATYSWTNIVQHNW